MGTGLKLYRAKAHPDHWIGEDKHGALLLFPAKPKGWASRTPYVGSKQELEEISPTFARGTKWPGAIGGKARDPSGKPSRRVTGIRGTDDERDTWQRASAAKELSLYEWIRRALNEVAARDLSEATARPARAKRSRSKP
jgi:hypothetical protein